jgi:hypothetical protein
MRSRGVVGRLLLMGVLAIMLYGCAVTPAGPYYHVSDNHPRAESYERFRLGPGDRYYVMHVENRTPFGVHELPRTMDLLYDKGYDRVRKERRADFSVDVFLSAVLRDNPNARAANTLGGALFGAAAGAIIGGAAGDPGAGAAIGAASGGVLGAVAPADTPMVRIDVNLHSFTDGGDYRKSVTVDLATVPPYDVPNAIDHEVSRMLSELPRQ